MYQIADPDPRLSSLLLPTLVLHLDGCSGSIPAALSPSLHFFLRGGGEILGLDGEYHPIPDAYLLGPFIEHFHTRYQPGTVAFSVCFRPGVLYEACSIHPAGLVGAYRLMHEVFPAEACQGLMQARHQQFSISDGLAAFQAFLLAVLPHSRTGLFADVLMKAQHKIFFPMVDLSEALGFGQRQLERRIMDAFGLPLRDIRRMSRYGYSMLHLLSNRPEHGELTRIAQEFGYYDQAHMAREFVSLIGHSPTQLLQKIASDDPGYWLYRIAPADFRRLFYVV